MCDFTKRFESMLDSYEEHYGSRQCGITESTDALINRLAKRAPEENSAGACGTQSHIPIYDIHRSKEKDLTVELERHKLDGSGKLQELQDRYREHLQAAHKNECCGATVKVNWKDIQSTKDEDLRAELIAHGVSVKGMKPEWLAAWMIHIKQFHRESLPDDDDVSKRDKHNKNKTR